MTRLSVALAAAIAASGLLSVSLPAAAQDTRTGLIADQQAEKAAALGPEGPSRAEILTVRLGSMLLAGPPVGPYPWIGSVLDGQGLSGGVGYRRPVGGQLILNGVAAISIRRATLLEASVDLPHLASDRLQVTGTARRVEAPSVAFYGLGPGSDRTRTTYTYDPVSVGIGVTARPGGPVVLGAGYDRLGFGPARDGGVLPGFTLDDTPGAAESLGYHVARLSAGLDWRPSPAYSVRGGFARARWSRYHETAGRPYSFTEREVEAAQLVPLVGEHIVLAFRALGTFTDADAGERLPFALAPTLGSGSLLRGFANRRFRDANRLLFTGEYRWMPSRYMDMAIFLERGQVAPTTDAFRWKDFEQSVGVGVRLHGPQFNVLRLEVARSREGLALIVATTQPF